MNDLSMNNQAGYLELILGPMFSGKTSRIVNLYKQYTYCNIPVIVINHVDDKRYNEQLLTTHDNIKINCVQSNSISDVITKYKTDLETFHVILINEGQFFEDLFESTIQLVNVMNMSVYICGLDGDYQANKFGRLLDLIPYCDKVTKLQSICAGCKNGNKAIFSHRKTNDNEQKLVGTDDVYEPLCRKCYLHNTLS